jgi:glycosyltransferase involved in cell wall biosynthesis
VAASRLVALKGALELPRIHRRIRDETGLRLVVTGRFSDESTRRAFGRVTEREGLKLGEDIVLAGFLPKEKYYETLARARVLVYPSHSDSFSLAILESLAVGTPVVAYDIPGPRSVYGGLPAVRFVREFDRRAMAEEAVRLAKMPEEERRGLVDDERVTSFLDDHSSWDHVAERLAEGIMEAAAAR